MYICERDQIVIDSFYSDRPDLGSLYDEYLDYASDALTAMPRPRFAQHDEPNRSFDNQRFSEVFGIDTAHSYHPLRQRAVLMDLVRLDYPDISATDLEELNIGVLFHDSGEAYTEEGDVAFGLPKNAEAEKRARTKLLHEVFGRVLGKKIVAMVDNIDPLTEKPSTPNAKIFELSEYMGYYLTGMAAADIYLDPLRIVNEEPITDPQLKTAGKIALDVYTKGHSGLVEAKESGSAAVRDLLRSGSGIMVSASSHFKLTQLSR